jgi:hypothetical protein
MRNRRPPKVAPETIVRALATKAAKRAAGYVSPHKRRKQSPEHVAKRAAALIGRNRPKQSPDHRQASRHGTQPA